MGRRTGRTRRRCQRLRLRRHQLPRRAAGPRGRPPPVTAARRWPAELFTFRGADPDAARRAAAELLALAEADAGAHEPWRLRDLALAASLRAEAAAPRALPVRIALVAASTDELRGLLGRAVAGEHSPDDGLFTSGPEIGSSASVLAERRTTDTFAARGPVETPRAAGSGPGPSDDPRLFGPDDARVAMLFPGQGSQRPGMFAELFVAFPELQRHLRLDPATARVLFPAAPFDEASRKEQRERITDTARAQPALGLTSLAAVQLLNRAGVRPAMAAGHSYGELAALAAAGVLAPEDLLRASHDRAAAVLGATGSGDPGTMAAVTASEPEVASALAEAGLTATVVTANRNSPARP